MAVPTGTATDIAAARREAWGEEPEMSTITERLTAYLIIGQEAGLDFTITASYDTRDPYAVRLDFPVLGPDGHLLNWIFGRALLDEGMSGPAGEGDVHVWPCGPDLIMLELCAEAGSALMALPARQVRAFLFLSYAEVPPGYEGDYIEIDQLLHDLTDRA
jgi:hypothetical protein